MRLPLKNKIPACRTDGPACPAGAGRRRCRPLLGTFVEITATHSNIKGTQRALGAAFGAIERVERLMSFHHCKSEVSKLNRLAARRPVRISPETFYVLKAAKKLYNRSCGVFDITIARQLVRWRLLPRHSFFSHRENGANTGDILLLPGNRVFFSRPLQIDLGGIAKGFAVDCAIAAMKKNGATGGLVNAGGDIRCFGKKKYALCLRHPTVPGAFLRFPPLCRAAFATSANSYQERKRRVGRVVCAHVDGRTRQPLLRPYSVSVRAPSCLLADALTKIVLALEEKAAALLSELNAEAFIVRSGKSGAFYEGRAK